MTNIIQLTRFMFLLICCFHYYQLLFSPLSCRLLHYKRTELLVLLFDFGVLAVSFIHHKQFLAAMINSPIIIIMLAIVRFCLFFFLTPNYSTQKKYFTLDSSDHPSWMSATHRNTNFQCTLPVVLLYHLVSLCLYVYRFHV